MGKAVHPDVIRYGLEEALIHVARGDSRTAHQILYLLTATTSQEDRVEAVAKVLHLTPNDLLARIWAQVNQNTPGEDT